MTTMTVTSGTCAYCGHHGDMIPASLQPGDRRGQCADGKACVSRLDKTGAAGALTRAEAAYAHLASFARGDVVDVESRTFRYPAVVMTPQQHDHADINRACLAVSNEGTEIRVTVGQLLAGHTITLRSEAGNVRYFDEAGYAAQNG